MNRGTKTLRVGIDCRMWNETGIGRYLRNIVQNLSALDSENEYILFMLTKDIETLETRFPANFKIVQTNIHWYTFKEQLLLPAYLYKERLDVFFSSGINVPILYLKKFVAVIHDLTQMQLVTGRASTHSKLFYFVKRVGMYVALYYAIHFSKKVFTVSEFSKAEIVKKFRIHESKVIVTYNAVDAHFSKQDSSVIVDVCRRYSIKTPYLFYIGNAYPHKNLFKLVEAFISLKNNHPDLHLVLAGKHDFFYERLIKHVTDKNLRDISFPGFIADKDLPALYSGSVALVNVSLQEGFGIQTLEAFACGTRVVCSNVSSLPEIAQNMAFYCNPHDVNSIAQALKACLADDSTERIRMGFVRASEFSWKRSASIWHNYIKSLDIAVLSI